MTMNRTTKNSLFLFLQKIFIPEHKRSGFYIFGGIFGGTSGQDSASASSLNSYSDETAVSAIAPTTSLLDLGKKTEDYDAAIHKKSVAETE